MKLTLFICNRCETIMQMDELPAGWRKGPRPFGVRSQTHYCRSCVPKIEERHRELDVELPWEDGESD